MATSAKSVWNGFLSFSMVSVPVKVYAAARTVGIGFNQVHQCKHTEPEFPELSGKLNGNITKINQQNFCPGCNTVVPYPELSKGYEMSDGKFIIVEKAELDSLSNVKSNSMTITEFVPMADVDPVYFDKSYFVVADGAVGRMPYEMLFRTMNNTKLAGVAKLTMRGETYNVIVRTYGNGIMIHTLFTAEEVRELIEYNAKRDEVAVNEVILGQAKTLLQSMVKAFDPAKLTDDYQKKVKALIEAKIATPGATGAPGASTTPRPSQTDDLRAALSASLFNQKAQKETEPPTEAPKKAKAAKVKV